MYNYSLTVERNRNTTQAPKTRQINLDDLNESYVVQGCRSGSTRMVALLSMYLVSNPVISTRYHSCQEQHHQVLTAPAVASPVSQSGASRPSRAAASIQRNGPRWPSTRRGAVGQGVIQSFRTSYGLRPSSVCGAATCRSAPSRARVP